VTLHHVYCDFCCIKFTSDEETDDVCPQCAGELEKRLERMRERCQQVALNDLLAQPDLVAAEKRFDGGASEQAARRIAARIGAVTLEET
jgi:hypothetical protein